MNAPLRKARTRVGVAVVGGALLAVGGTATAAVVTSSPGTAEVADVAPLMSSEPAPTTAAGPTPVSDTPAPTVATVTDTPEPTVAAPTPPTGPSAAEAPAPEPAADPTPYDPTAPWTDSTGLTYIPAPTRSMDPIPGEGPQLNETPIEAG